MNRAAPIWSCVLAAAGLCLLAAACSQARQDLAAADAAGEASPSPDGGAPPPDAKPADASPATDGAGNADVLPTPPADTSPADDTAQVDAPPPVGPIDIGPVCPAGNCLRGATLLAAGMHYTCAVVAGGAVKCWGANASFQLGRTTAEPNAGTPGLVPGLTSVTAIAAGDSHTCVLQAGGAVKCWGLNYGGQLGTSGETLPMSVTPVAVAGASGIISLSAGSSYTCGATSAGTVLCWGANGTGMLGRETDTTSVAMPTAIANVSDATGPVSAGHFHACATGAGVVRCWGSNTWSQLGAVVSGVRSTAVAVTGLAPAQMLAAGAYHTCALVGGGVRCWGGNGTGNLGNGKPEDSLQPVAAVGISDAIAVAARQGVSCALLRGGLVQCWGANFNHQLGNGSNVNARTPVTVHRVSGATAITVGAQHACAVVAEGMVQCWGRNAYGQLGTGDTVDAPLPRAVRSE